mgnify:CR=1 FL=1
MTDQRGIKYTLRSDTGVEHGSSIKGGCFLCFLHVLFTHEHERKHENRGPGSATVSTLHARRVSLKAGHPRGPDLLHTVHSTARGPAAARRRRRLTCQAAAHGRELVAGSAAHLGSNARRLARRRLGQQAQRDLLVVLARHRDDEPPLRGVRLCGKHPPARLGPRRPPARPPSAWQQPRAALSLGQPVRAGALSCASSTGARSATWAARLDLAARVEDASEAVHARDFHPVADGEEG